MKGPAEGTSAKRSQSIERECAAIVARDDFLEQLRRIAEDAQNFKVRLFHASEDSAIDEWGNFPSQKSQWMRRYADGLKAYMEKIREIFAERAAMASNFNKNWPLFKVHHDVLFGTIREIYVRAGKAVSSHEDESEELDSEVEHNIQLHMAKCELEIKRAANSPFKSFEAWMSQERDRQAKTSGPATQPSRLPRKGTGLSKYADWFEAANLTELQREIVSLRLEYGLSFRAIAKRQGKDPTTVREHYEAARRKIEEASRPPKKPKS